MFERNWEAQKTELLKRFSPSDAAIPYEQLDALYQNGWVEDYVQKFEKLTNCQKFPNNN